ncbi:MAG: GLPGLI family protein [Mucilaginibacter sp.]|uniref:GLPGLI family protein n=1 Tax=Mucilaginibacter sp. TaxID=1882438 RepID=UPI0034E47228
MKKHILLLPAILLIFQLVKAQKPDATIAIVRYTFSHIRDTTDKAKVYTENMELLLGKNASVYRSADQRLHDEKMKKLIAERAKTGTTSMVNFSGVGGPRGSATKFYQFQAEKKIIRQEKIINIYLMDETLPAMNWTILTDTISFGTLHCQKAKTTFKGRNYEAWFCPTLPFRSGPWKLNGLPGLIVEANDTKKEVVWKFAGLEDVSKIAENSVSVAEADNSSERKSMTIFVRESYSFKIIELPKDGLKTTEKEFARLDKAVHENPTGFINAAYAAAGSSAKVYSTSPVPARKPINNPIELSDKP